MIEEYLRYGKLYDFYGNLLSEAQNRAIRLYYLEDFSINEIAEEEGLTKQTIFENLKRGERNLESYEEKLRLIERFEREKGLRPEIFEKFEELKDKVEELEELLEKIKGEGI